jgi:hypothetical protein
VTFSGDPLFKIKPGDLERAGLKAIPAPDAFALIDDHWSFGQFGNGLDRTDPGTRWSYSVMAGPVFVGLLGLILAVDAEVDHDPVVGCEAYVSVGDQLISFNFQIIPPLAGGHTTFATNASPRIHQFPISLCLRSSNAGRSQRRISRGTG